MKETTKGRLQGLMFCAMLMASGFMAAHEAQSKDMRGVKAPAAKTIEVIGATQDGKYKVYQLKGDLDGPNFFAGNTVYKSSDLFGKMDYIKKEDVNAHGYTCQFICKDGYQNVVGINPNFAFLAPKK
jgi:hypothetical protein